MEPRFKGIVNFTGDVDFFGSSDGERCTALKPGVITKIKYECFGHRCSDLTVVFSNGTSEVSFNMPDMYTGKIRDIKDVQVHNDLEGLRVTIDADATCAFPDQPFNQYDFFVIEEVDDDDDRGIGDCIEDRYDPDDYDDYEL